QILVARALFAAGCAQHDADRPDAALDLAARDAAPVDASHPRDLTPRPDLAGTAPCTTGDDCARTDGGATIAGTRCEGACIDFFDPASCGGCGVVCPTGPRRRPPADRQPERVRDPWPCHRLLGGL